MVFIYFFFLSVLNGWKNLKNIKDDFYGGIRPRKHAGDWRGIRHNYCFRGRHVSKGTTAINKISFFSHTTLLIFGLGCIVTVAPGKYLYGRPYMNGGAFGRDCEFNKFAPFRLIVFKNNAALGHGLFR